MRLSLVLASLSALALATACKSGDNASAVKVVGGVEANGGFPQIHHFEVDAARGRVCSAVAVSQNTALMAGHCIKANTLDHGVVDVETGLRSEKIYAWLAMKGVETMDERYAARDVAVVVFPQGSFQSWLPLARAVDLAQPVQIVGYGAAGFDNLDTVVRQSRGVKRVGKNKIAQLRPGLIVVSADVKAVGPNNAVAAAGDSGGPLLDQNNGIIGLAAAMYLLNDKGAVAPLTTDPDGYKVPVAQGAVKAFNFFADINSPASQRLLRYAVAQGQAEIPGIASSTEPLDLSDYAWTRESLLGDLGPMVAMCGGGGGGFNTGNNGFGNTGTNGFGNTGNNGFGNTGNNNGFGGGNTTNNGVNPGSGATNNGRGNGGQFGGPPGSTNGTAGAGDATRGRAAVQQSCASVGCHSHANNSDAQFKQQLRNPTGSMISPVQTLLGGPSAADVRAYMNAP